MVKNSIEWWLIARLKKTIGILGYENRIGVEYIFNSESDFWRNTIYSMSDELKSELVKITRNTDVDVNSFLLFFGLDELKTQSFYQNLFYYMNDDSLNMFDIQNENKRLILHSAYFAILQHNWKDKVFSCITSKSEKKLILGMMPCGYPMNNLMILASRLLPEFDENISINKNVEIIKRYIDL